MATAHYATAELDQGPIIDQDVTPISHRDDVDDWIRKGRDLERVVFAPAVRCQLEDRILVFGNKTLVFDGARSIASSATGRNGAQRSGAHGRIRKASHRCMSLCIRVNPTGHESQDFPAR